jgi:TM2 domain-containing membrane protein YozV
MTQLDWYYVGNYGQLGPLTFEQVQEFVRDGVIAPNTFVWNNMMLNWEPAEKVPQLMQIFAQNAALNGPPPIPMQAPPSMPQAPMQNQVPGLLVSPFTQMSPVSHQQYAHPYAVNYALAVPISDKSRVVAGILQIIPGVGRMYLGYWAQGAIQMISGFLCGVGVIWSFVDGVAMLLGNTKYDGYGRVLRD